MLSFDRDSLKRQLDGMSSRSQTVFALACAERLMPLYGAFSEKHVNSRWNYLRLMAENLWENLLKNKVLPNDEFLKEYSALAPNDDWPSSEFNLLNPLAENAVLALGAAWKCHILKDVRNAVFAAGHAYEAADYLAQNAEGLDYRDTGGEEAILKSVVVQDELKRQMSSLTVLEQTSELEPQYLSVINSLRVQSIDTGEDLRKMAQSLVKPE